jgi:insecticidal toxin complex protein TccC
VKQQSSTLHIGTHILSESNKDNTQSPNQTRYQLTSHLQSNTLELNDNCDFLLIFLHAWKPGMF